MRKNDKKLLLDCYNLLNGIADGNTFTQSDIRDCADKIKEYVGEDDEIWIPEDNDYSATSGNSKGCLSLIGEFLFAIGVVWIFIWLMNQSHGCSCLMYDMSIGRM